MASSPRSQHRRETRPSAIGSLWDSRSIQTPCPQPTADRRRLSPSDEQGPEGSEESPTTFPCFLPAFGLLFQSHSSGSPRKQPEVITTIFLSLSLSLSPAPSTAPAKPTCSTPELVTLAYYAGWPPKEIPKLMRTMWKESRCIPSARNKWATGLMQVHKLHLPRLCISEKICNRLQLLDPFRNLVAAHDVWSRSGWKAWTGGGA